MNIFLDTSRSQALPGNALHPRLCLTSPCERNGHVWRFGSCRIGVLKGISVNHFNEFFCLPSVCQMRIWAKKLRAKKWGDLCCSFCPDHEKTQRTRSSNSAYSNNFFRLFRRPNYSTLLVGLIQIAWLLHLTTNSNADSGRDANVAINNETLIVTSQEKVVKLYGAGGARGLESYQSGIIIDNSGHILTSWSTVLDVAKVRVVTFDGRRLDATMVGMDPQNELAILKVDDGGLVGFDLSKAAPASPGQRVFAISNLFGIAAGNESCSAQKGVIMASTSLTTRRGKTRSLYQGRVYVLDAMTNNPGASGGALIDLQGRLVGILGKEIRDEQAGIWLNYALPMDVVKSSVDRILSGNTSFQSSGLKAVAQPHRINDLGITLIPDVLAKTPPYVDQVRDGSVASRAGLQTNDLILLLNDQRADSRKGLEKMLATINRADSFYVLVQRGQELIRIHVLP